MKIRNAVAAMMLACATLAQAASDEIVFTTAPTDDRQDTERYYQPLIKYLGEVTGKKVVVDAASNFIEYSIRMRMDKYDIMFDGPHLAGWRIDNMEHEPLVRLPGTIKIVVIAREDSAVGNLEELGNGRSRVCAFASPNMLTMAFLSYFPNPSRQPMMLRVQGFDELEKCLRKGRGEVAVLRDKLWEKMDQTGLKLIAAPERGYPERTLTVSTKRVDAETRAKLREALLSPDGQKAAMPVLELFKKEKFIPAKSADYEGLGELLKPVWGFHRE